MRLIQFESGDRRRVGIVDGDTVQVLAGVAGTRELALRAARAGSSLAAAARACGADGTEDYARLLADARLLPPLDHEDPAHCLFSGTGLTHLGGASARDQMHQKDGRSGAELTDSLRMFRWGIEGGKPPAGEAGVAPEWFYKGDGSILVRPGAPIPVPDFAEDAGEEPEIVGLYVIGDDGRPYRLGFALCNEFSDHVIEKRNYLYLAHSKLRFAAIGPELRTGPLPAHLEGISRIVRDGRVIWSKAFLSGEDNMCHSIRNLEFHHFKYDQFLRPGDVHIHSLGTATLSFADGVRTQIGDAFEISIPEFGAPLINGTVRAPSRTPVDGVVAL